MCNVGYGPHCRDCELAPSCDVTPGRTLTITIPDQIHPSLNRLNTMHWAARNRLKKEWAEDIFWRTKAAHWKGPAMKRALVRIEYFCGDKRRRDKDNHNPKMICDSLVRAGVLADDNSRVVDLDWTIHPEGPRRTVIRITELEGGEAA